jgi:hypothetical protein
MGQLCVKFSGSSKIDSPTRFVNIDKTELLTILRNTFHLKDNSKIVLADADYMCLYSDDVVKFLASDPADTMSYKKEIRDCDEFARILQGRCLEWVAKTCDIPRGVCFGTLYGDVRKQESDTKVRGHAVNFYLDENKKVRMIEPQTDALFSFTSNSTAWNVMM